MKYDPIKKVIGDVVRDNVLLRKLFYGILGLLFLREWHVKRELRRIFSEQRISSMFDAGSGFGQYSYFCATHFPDVRILAVDVKEDQIADCSRFFQKAGITNVSFAVEDLTKPLHRDEFDLILSVDVMEHIADDMTVFRNLARVLRPNGRLLVNTPSTLGGSDVHSPGEKSFIEEHARIGYEPDEIRRKLESSGLSVEHIRFTYGRWGTIAWRLGIKIPMVLLNINKVFFLLLPFSFLITLPFTLFFMYLDYVGENKEGTGLLVVARKPSDKSETRKSKFETSTK